MGRVIEPRKINIVGVDAVIAAEDINRCTEWSGAQAHRGRRAGHVRRGLPRNLGDPVRSLMSCGFGRSPLMNLQATWGMCLHPVWSEMSGTIEVPPAQGNRRQWDGSRKSDRSIVPMKRGNRSHGTPYREGSVGTRNRRRERWPAHQGRQPSQRNKRG